jgi:hypothetical protein
MFLTSNQYLEQVKRVLGADETVSVAVAFWGSGSEQLFVRRGGSTKILCNLLSGATNPDVVEALRCVDGIEIRRLDDLHAKVILNSSEAIVGSANISTNGLNLEGKESAGWREAGFLVNDASQIVAMQDWFDDQWAVSSEITDGDVELARRRWGDRRAARPIASDAKRLLDLDVEQLNDQRIYVVLYCEEACNESDKIAEKQISQAVAVSGNEDMRERLSHFDRWPELPKDGPLLCFWYGRRFGLTDDGVWARLPTLDASYSLEGEVATVEIVERKEDVNGLLYEREDARRLAQKLKPVMRRILERGAMNGSVFLSLYDALTIQNQ